MCSYSLPMANHMLQKRNHILQGTDSSSEFFLLLCHSIKRHMCPLQGLKKANKQYYEEHHHYKEISYICPGTDVSTSIITATLTNLIPFSVHSSNFWMTDIAQHLSSTEILNLQFSNTFNHSQRTQFILLKSRTEEDVPSQGILSIFQKPVSEIQFSSDRSV